MSGAKRLKRWRERVEMSQMHLSRALQVAQGTVCRWETGQSAPGLAAAIAIAKLTKGSVPVESWTKQERTAA